MDRHSDAYEEDFYAWTQSQAAALRHAAERRVNLDLDFENLAEEIESLGREQRHAIESALRLILLHLAKLVWSPAEPPRAGWEHEVGEFRIQLDKRLRDNPGLKPHLPRLFADAWSDARRLATRELARDGVTEPMPDACPFRIEQIRDPDWWPDNRFGLR